MWLRTLLPLLALAGALCAQTAAPASAECGNTPLYSPCEVVFELTGKAAAAHPEPYSSVEMRAEFRSSSMRTYAVPAYWDGGARMVLRFAPTEAGDWEYRITSNVPEWDGKIGKFTAVASSAPGFVQVANMHHWATSAATAPHLWMGATEMRFGFLDDAAFQSLADARAAQKFNHLRGLVLGDGADHSMSGANAPDLAYFRRLDARILYLNQKGITADLVLASNPETLTKLLPTPEARRHFVRFLAGRYAAMNVTWQGLAEFDQGAGGRPLLNEIGTLLKQYDPYDHPRTSGAETTSAPLLDDHWMSFIEYGTPDNAVGAIEHQLYQLPGVNAGIAAADGATARHNLWNTTMNGQYPESAAGDKTMTAWFNFMSGTRHWDIEPYFDIDGGRALALPGVEYIAYIEKPGPIELIVEKHGYDVFWMDPADGTMTERRKWNGDHFTGVPPDSSHDWVLHVVRQGTLESMNRSYKFESRDVPVQEIVIEPNKVPFEIEKPTGDLTVGKPAACSAKITRATRATRSMLWMWTGEVTAGHQGYRVLGTGQQPTCAPPAGLTQDYPAVMLLRLYGMNNYGTVYLLAKGYGLNQ
jgi:hypothetical protein